MQYTDQHISVFHSHTNDSTKIPKKLLVLFDTCQVVRVSFIWWVWYFTTEALMNWDQRVDKLLISFLTQTKGNWIVFFIMMHSIPT